MQSIHQFMHLFDCKKRIYASIDIYRSMNICIYLSICLCKRFINLCTHLIANICRNIYLYIDNISINGHIDKFIDIVRLMNILTFVSKS